MAKFKIEIEFDTIIKTFSFMGQEFINTWVPDNRGSRTLECAFDAQVEQKFPDIPEDLMELINDIDCMDEDEAQDALEQLSIYEEQEATHER